MNVLVIDVGGTHVKILATGQKVKRQMDSSPKLTAEQMAAGVRALAQGWKYELVSIGYPGPVARDQPTREPYNLGRGWPTMFLRAICCARTSMFSAVPRVRGLP